MSTTSATLFGQPDDTGSALRAAWAAATEGERATFLLELRAEYLSRPRAAVPTPKGRPRRRLRVGVDGHRCLEALS